MKTFNNKYRGFIISINQIDEDRSDYKVLNADKSLVKDTEGYCVSVDEAMETCKETIDDILGNKPFT